MLLETSQIDLDSLKVNKNKTNFSLEDNQSEIEYLARTIVTLGGRSVRIPVVQQVGIEEYELISGYFDYYALLKAREINPELPDRIRVFVINKKNQDAVLNQLKSIEKLEKISRHPQGKQSSNNNQDTKDIKIANLSSKVQESEKVIISNLDSLKTAILNEINSKIPKPLPLLDALNQILDDRVCEQVLKKMSFLGKKKAQKIVNQLRDQKKAKNIQFNTFQDVLDSLNKGSISKEKLLEVIDSWN